MWTRMVLRLDGGSEAGSAIDAAVNAGEESNALGNEQQWRQQHQNNPVAQRAVQKRTQLKLYASRGLLQQRDHESHGDAAREVGKNEQRTFDGLSFLER